MSVCVCLCVFDVGVHHEVTTLLSYVFLLGIMGKDGGDTPQPDPPGGPASGGSRDLDRVKLLLGKQKVLAVKRQTKTTPTTTTTRQSQGFTTKTRRVVRMAATLSR